MHRSNNICPISDIWTVVCCVFDSAGFYWNYLCWRKCFLHLIEKITPIQQTLQVNHKLGEGKACDGFEKGSLVDLNDC